MSDERNIKSNNLELELSEALASAVPWKPPTSYSSQDPPGVKVLIRGYVVGFYPPWPHSLARWCFWNPTQDGLDEPMQGLIKNSDVDYWRHCDTLEKAIAATLRLLDGSG